MKRVYLIIVGSALILGTIEVALKFTDGSFDPFQITFLRFIIGGLVLLPFAVDEYKKQPKGFMKKRLWVSMLLLGAVFVPFCMMLFQFGVINSNAATAAVIFCSNPIFTMLFANFMTDNDKMNRQKIVSMSLGVAGLILIVSPWDMQEGNTLIGVVYLIGAAAAFGFYSVLGSRTVGRVGVFTQTSTSFIIGAMILFCIMLLMNRPIFTGVAENIGIILYIGIIVTGGGFALYFLAMKYTNPTTASIVFLLKPIIAPIFAVILLGEAITRNMLFGIGLLLVASYTLTFKKLSRTH